MIHRTSFRVRYAETDQMGVVYHGAYLAWCEVGRTELIRDAGMSYAQMEARGVRLAVSEAHLRYHAAARYDDLVQVETRLTDVGSRGMRFEYLITHAVSGARLVSAWTSLVSLAPSGRTEALPADVRELLARVLATTR